MTSINNNMMMDLDVRMTVNTPSPSLMESEFSHSSNMHPKSLRSGTPSSQQQYSSFDLSSPTSSFQLDPQNNMSDSPPTSTISQYMCSKDTPMVPGLTWEDRASVLREVISFARSYGIINPNDPYQEEAIRPTPPISHDTICLAVYCFDQTVLSKTRRNLPLDLRTVHDYYILALSCFCLARKFHCASAPLCLNSIQIIHEMSREKFKFDARKSILIFESIIPDCVRWAFFSESPVEHFRRLVESCFGKVQSKNEIDEFYLAGVKLIQTFMFDPRWLYYSYDTIAFTVFMIVCSTATHSEFFLNRVRSVAQNLGMVKEEEYLSCDQDLRIYWQGTVVNLLPGFLNEEEGKKMECIEQEDDDDAPLRSIPSLTPSFLLRQESTQAYSQPELFNQISGTELHTLFKERARNNSWWSSNKTFTVNDDRVVIGRANAGKIETLYFQDDHERWSRITKHKINAGEYGTVYSDTILSKSNPAGHKIYKHFQDQSKIEGNGLFSATLREIAAAVALPPHPNLGQVQQVQVFSFKKKPSTDDQMSYSSIIMEEEEIRIVAVMEYYPTTLQDFVSEKTCMWSPANVKKVFYGICKGLQHLHHRKFAHRDLSAGNVLLNNNLDAKIIDFGLARTKSGHLSPGVCAANFRPPEILFSKFSDNVGNFSRNTRIEYCPFSVDVWSLGCIFVYLLKRGTMFEGAEYVADIMNLMESYLGNCPNRPKKMRVDANKPKQGFKIIKPERDPNLCFENFTQDKHALSLIRAMLHYDPLQRPTMDQILQHPYFNTQYNF